MHDSGPVAHGRRDTRSSVGGIDRIQGTLRDLDAVSVEMMSVENNYFTHEIEEYMSDRGYRMVGIAGRDEFYRKR